MTNHSYVELAAQARRRARRARTLSNTFFVLAAAFGIAGVVMLIIPGQFSQSVVTGGIEQQLKLYSGLWFFPDGSMYVYYTPEFWGRP